MIDNVAQKVERLAESSTIPLESVDFTVNDRERLRTELGPTFAYFARVENEVAADPLMTMMPRLGTNYRGYQSHGEAFLKVWVEQERAHGVILMNYKDALVSRHSSPK
jgi:predicted ATPase